MRRLWRLMLWQMGKRSRYFPALSSDDLPGEHFLYDDIKHICVRAEAREDRALTHLWRRFQTWRYWGNESLFNRGR